VLHCVLGGPEPEPAEEARGQKTSDAAAGHVSAKEVSWTQFQRTYCMVCDDVSGQF